MMKEYWCYAARLDDGGMLLGMPYSSNLEALFECNEDLKRHRGSNSSVAVFPLNDYVADKNKTCRYFYILDGKGVGMSDVYFNRQECYKALREWIKGVEHPKDIKAVGIENGAEWETASGVSS